MVEDVKGHPFMWMCGSHSLEKNENLMMKTKDIARKI